MANLMNILAGLGVGIAIGVVIGALLLEVFGESKKSGESGDSGGKDFMVERDDSGRISMIKYI